MFKATKTILTRTSAVLAASLLLLPLPGRAGPSFVESGFWQPEVEAGNLPPIAERLPLVPLVVDLAAKGRQFGVQGGTLNTMVTRSKDIRQMVVYGYARLVGYTEDYQLQPDILLGYENEGNKRYTLKLRPGHRWSNGDPFTSADFEYWWKDIANNPSLSPAGPPDFMYSEGELPQVSFPDETTVIFEWQTPHPQFLQNLAQARPPFIYRPSAYLKQFHVDYADAETLAEEVDYARVKSWAALHNKYDNMYKFDNHELPTLQPWMNATAGKRIRHQFVRNPFYHRVDSRGVQLPYIDTVEMEIVAGGLVAAKSNAGQADLQARGLGFRDIPILRKGENDGGTYKTYLWGTGAASQIAIYPNLNTADPVWRNTLRDVRVRRALSLAINRAEINKVLFYGLARESANTVLPESPLFKPEYASAWSTHDPDQANELLDAAGLQNRDIYGTRQLPDGRQAGIIIESAGESTLETDVLELVTDHFREVGLRLYVRTSQRDVFRSRALGGDVMMSVWFGLDNAVPTADMPPAALAPTAEDQLQWPVWGLHYMSAETSGKPPELDEAQELVDLLNDWRQSKTTEEREVIWHKMLEINADQVFSIGTVNGALQPIVHSSRMRNVPEKGLYGFAPMSYLGAYMPDTFWYEGEG